MSEPEMPKEARRRGGADTLFSADWFDDQEGWEKDEEDEPSAPPESTPVATTAPDMSMAEIGGEEVAESEGMSMMMMVIVALGVFALLSVFAGLGVAGVMVFMGQS